MNDFKHHATCHAPTMEFRPVSLERELEVQWRSKVLGGPCAGPRWWALEQQPIRKKHLLFRYLYNVGLDRQKYKAIYI